MTYFNVTGTDNSQTLFDSSSTGALSSKRSYVDMVNIIFARTAVTTDRAESVNDISRQNKLSDYLVWKQVSGEKVVEVVPPSTEWDYRVYSIDERNQLLLDEDFFNLVTDGKKPRVLVDGMSNYDAPQWSVWEGTLDNVPVDSEDTVDVQTPDQSDVFNTWSRINGAEYFEAGTTIPSGDEANSWAFVSNKITSTVNSASLIGFISPNKLVSYKHTLTVGSTNADDDMIGIILAFDIVNGVPYSLVAERACKGSNVGVSWALTQWAGGTRTILVSGESTIGASTGGWSTYGEIAIEAVRTNNHIAIKTSQKGSQTVDNTTLLQYDIPADSPFYGACKYGYCAWSQADAYFSNIELLGYGTHFLISNPNLVFKPAKSYDHVVDTLSERDALKTAVFPVIIGERVLVNGNSDTAQLWTIWKYVGVGQNGANSAGFKLVRYQTYNTEDFYSLVDWYDDGYSPTVSPVITYDTIGARNAVENPSPTSTFVRVKDDGTGSWVWTSYVDGSWNVVAREKGTIALSTNLYADGLDSIGFDPISNNDVSKFATRDGSWELKTIIDIFQTSTILTDLEKNELFFSLVHYAHSQQDLVPWAFKTSFLNLGGYNELIDATPVTPIDNTQNLLDYINEVKPYRVKTRSFVRVLNPNMDTANVLAYDFDFPPYYDSFTNSYRYLDLNNQADLNIIKTTAPWNTWYANYTKPEWEVDSYNTSSWNPVRHFKISMLFDRIDHMPILEEQKFNFSGKLIQTTTLLTNVIVEVLLNGNSLPSNAYTASNYLITLANEYSPTDTIEIIIRQDLTENAEGYRIYNSYSLTDGIEEKNVIALMSEDQRLHDIDGGTFNDPRSDYIMKGDNTHFDDSINPKDSYNGLTDPYHRSKPEELALTGAIESVQFNVVEYSNSTTISNAAPLTTPSTMDFFYDANSNPSYPVQQAWRISSAIPTTDMMLPKESGDFDARPLDEISFDVLEVDLTSFNNGVELGNYVISSKAWEYTKASPSIGYLVNTVQRTDNTITFVPTYTVNTAVSNARDEAYIFETNTVSNNVTFTGNLSYSNPLMTSQDGNTAVFFFNNGNYSVFTLQDIHTGNLLYNSVSNSTIHNNAPANANIRSIYASISTAIPIRDTDYFLVGGLTDAVGAGSWNIWYTAYRIDTATNSIVKAGGIIQNYGQLVHPPTFHAAYMETGGVYVTLGIGYSTQSLHLVKLPPLDQWNDQNATPTYERQIGNTTNWAYDAHSYIREYTDDNRGMIANVGSQVRYYFFVPKARAQLALNEYYSANVANGGTSILWGYLCQHVKNNCLNYSNGWMGYVPFDASTNCTVDTGFVSAFPLAESDRALDGTYTTDWTTGFTELFTATKKDNSHVRLAIHKQLNGSHNSNVGMAAAAYVVDLNTINGTWNYISNVGGPTVNTVSYFGASNVGKYNVLKTSARIAFSTNDDLTELYGISSSTQPKKQVITHLGTYIPAIIAENNSDDDTDPFGKPKTLDVIDETGNQVVSTKKPGVVWINDERIEFYDYSINANAVTLKELKRGTHRTHIGKEYIKRYSFTGDGSNRTFVMNGIADINNLSIVAYEVLRNANGAVIITDTYTGATIPLQKTIGTDFNAVAGSNSVTVTFNYTPINGTKIFGYKPIDVSHAANSRVYNGTYIFEHRKDNQYGGDTNY